MKDAIRRLLELLIKPHLVEFDYRDRTGAHHGRCYVHYLFGGRQQAKRLLSSFGYTNIHIA